MRSAMQNEESARWGATEFYVSPKDIVADPVASTEEKRALLASWASDARAVKDVPTLRQLDNGALVFIDDVLDALKQLDCPAASGPAKRGTALSRRHGGQRRRLGIYRRPRRDDDDDGPTPTPAIVRPPTPLAPLTSEAVAA